MTNEASRMRGGARSSGSPLISVIMPCFNAEKYLGEAVESVLNQSFLSTELIVVDDGSTDRSREILDTYGSRIKVLSQTNRGPYAARNLGLRAALGHYIAFLDSDDWWLPEALEKLLNALMVTSADIAYCGWQNVGEGIQSQPYVPPAYEDEDTVAHFVRTCPWPIHAALVRRELVERLGGFSERRFSSMDYDFWLRALAATRRIQRVPEVLAFYRWHDQGQVSSVKWRQVLDALDAQKRFIQGNPELVAHLSTQRLQDLTEGQVLRQAYRAVWKRDLDSAQKLFRHVAANGSFRLQDLRHVAPALLPATLYRGLMEIRDRRTA
jgi:glycosyltransferase involved in cell wall biosynthesis